MVAKQTYSFTYIFNLEYYIEKTSIRCYLVEIDYEMMLDLNWKYSTSYRICFCGIDLILLNSLQATITMKNQVFLRK